MGVQAVKSIFKNQQTLAMRGLLAWIYTSVNNYLWGPGGIKYGGKHPAKQSYSLFASVLGREQKWFELLTKGGHQTGVICKITCSDIKMYFSPHNYTYILTFTLKSEKSPFSLYR